MTTKSEVESGKCPHCGEALQPFTLPEEGGWNTAYHCACFNDQCSYYKDGWDWMWERYQVRASYRYRVDPQTHNASPLAVWSETALRDRIISDGSGDCSG